MGQARSTKWLTQTDQFKEDLVVVRAGSSSSIWVDEIHHEEEVPRHPSAIAGYPKSAQKHPDVTDVTPGRYGGYGSRLETQQLSDFTPTWYPSNGGPQFSTQKNWQEILRCRPRTEFDRVDLRVGQHKPGGETEPPTNPTSTGWLWFIDVEIVILCYPYG